MNEQALFIPYGVGANGKSTLLGLLEGLLGGYARSKPADTVLARRESGGIPNDLARLDGFRFVLASEFDDGKRLAESRIKAMDRRRPHRGALHEGESGLSSNPSSKSGCRLITSRS